MQGNIGKAVKATLIFLILVTLSFIYIQSMLPREQSSKESDAVGDIVAGIVPPETKPGAFLQLNLRKVAHFLEFALLGGEITLYILLFMRRGIVIYLSLISAPIVALLDETIQIYSGRASSIIDVLIDTSGFLTAAAIFYTVAAIVMLIRKNVNKNGQKQTVE